MEYTKKHKNLIAKLFKKVGMLEEADIVLSLRLGADKAIRYPRVGAPVKFLSQTEKWKINYLPAESPY